MLARALIRAFTRWIGTGRASPASRTACFRGSAADLVEFFFCEEDGLAKDSVEADDGGPDSFPVAHIESVIEFAKERPELLDVARAKGNVARSSPGRPTVLAYVEPVKDVLAAFAACRA